MAAHRGASHARVAALVPARPVERLARAGEGRSAVVRLRMRRGRPATCSLRVDATVVSLQLNIEVKGRRRVA
jgi:hypothetical protein